MKESPYGGFLDVMTGVAGENKTPEAQIGVIITPPPAITVAYKGITLNAKDILINDFLLVNYYREYKGHIKSATQNRSGGAGDAMFESHNHDIDNDYTLTSYTTTTLKTGDKVFMMPMSAEDGTSQKYVICFRVVETNGGDVNNG